jgi:rhodanese-related sulfurtransferase
MERVRSRTFLSVLWMSAAFLNGAIVLTLQEESSRAARGEAIYATLCLRCHGESGDDTSYPGIVPLAGIGRRLPDGEIAELSAPFVGRIFNREDSVNLVAFLKTLQGEKGFGDPGWLISPYLLDRKAGEIRHFRLIDARAADAYRQGHIRNSASWPMESSSRPKADEVRRRLEEAGVSSDTIVVVYDQEGGPQAASLWWSILDSGHRKVAMLDGGWQHWRNSGYPATSVVPRFPAGNEFFGSQTSDCAGVTLAEPVRNLSFGNSAQAGEASYDWRRVIGKTGFLEAAEVFGILQQAGLLEDGTLRFSDARPDLYHLMFILHLLGGYSVCLDEKQGMLFIRPV